MLPYTLTPSTLSIYVGGRMQIVPASHMNFDKLVAAIKANEWHRVKTLIDLPTYVAKLTAGDVAICDNVVLFKGEVIPGALSARILRMMAEGFSVAPLARFMHKLLSNGTPTAKDELFLWMESANLPITEDGDFLAFKKVRHDYRSYTSSPDKTHLLHTLGEYVQMPREEVDANRYNTCSSGLHFCSYSYLPHYYGGEGRVLVVKINPADVIAIPSDYSNAKGRAACYKVVDEVDEEETSRIFKESVSTRYSLASDQESDDYYQGWDDAGEREEEVVDFSFEECDDVCGQIEESELDADDFYISAYVEPFSGYETEETELDEDSNASGEMIFEHHGVRFSATTLIDMVNNNGQRATSAALGIPRSTLQDWIERSNA